MNKSAIEKVEAVLQLNPADFNTLYLLFMFSRDGHRFFVNNSAHVSCPYSLDNSLDFYFLKINQYAHKILTQPGMLEEGNEVFKYECCYELALVFSFRKNHQYAHKYSKLAYECCLRLRQNQTHLADTKALYLKSCAALTKLPSLRFAVGDEVEYLHEGEWKLCKIVELYYRELDFDLRFTAPYRLQLLDDSDSTDPPPVHALVQADLDRYIRKVGVRSIEDTRYHARLNAKVEKLSQVYYSKEFMQDIYHTLAQDREFVDMLRSVWGIELSESMVLDYRELVMYRELLIRTDTGYHVPTVEEVIAGIRAFFDPAHLNDDATPSAAVDEDRDSQRVRADVLSLLRGDYVISTNFDVLLGVQGFLLRSVRAHTAASLSSVSPSTPTDPGEHADTPDAWLKESNVRDLRAILPEPVYSSRSAHGFAWAGLKECLESRDTAPACECPFVYFFVKFCLDQDVEVPKLALALYDRMNMQLSREFIRCANPTCELNRLDQSTGQVKFKKCSRCLAVIYCCRECQVAHYPEHKKLCWEPTKA